MDEKLAQYFLSTVRTGDRVTYEVHGKAITLTHGDEKLSVDSSKWRGNDKTRGIPLTLERDTIRDRQQRAIASFHTF